MFFEVFGEGEPTLVLVPANPIVHSRQWKAQVHYLSRHYRVVTFDGRGNGRSDRPADPAAYAERGYLAELKAVLDATGSDRVVLVGLCQDGLEASLEAMLASMVPSELTREQVETICRRVRAPLLLVHGDDDRCQPLARAERLAELTGAPLVVLEGAGHLPTARHPVKLNLLIREFVDHLANGG